MASKRVGLAAMAALLLFGTSCGDKGGKKTPLEPQVEEPRDAWISGQVVVEGQGLEGVDVNLTGPESRSATTDAQGAFDFTQLARGTYTLAITGFDADLLTFAVSRQTVSATDGTKAEVQFEGTWVPQPPESPTGLVATATGPEGVTLGWSDESDDETGFEVERRTGADGAWGGIGVTGADVTEYADAGLSPNTAYTYRVRACNDAGCSAYTSEASATTDDVPPRAPGDLAAEAGGPTAVGLSWTDRSANEAEFQVERKVGADGSWTRVETTDADVEAWTDNGLASLTTYTYRVRACNALGCSAFSGEASATTPDHPPAAPSGLTATAAGPETIDLAWTDASDNETGFRVERMKGSGGSWSAVATPGAGTEELRDTGLSPATAYRYRVQACGDGGCSAFSNEAGATTDGLDGPNLFIETLSITQSTQTPAGRVPLVAGKPGFLRVFVQADEANDYTPDVRVRFYLGGSLEYTATLPAPGSAVPTSVLESSLGYFWTLPVPASLIQPGLSILAEVDPANQVPEPDEGDNVFPTSGLPQALDVRSTADFDVMFVPVRQSVNDLTGNVSSGNADAFFEVVLDMLPIARAAGSVHAPYTTDAEVLENDNGNGAWGTILGEMFALRVAEGGARHYFGVVKTSYTSGVAGMGYLGWPGAVGWDRLPSAAGVAAHEWGHNWNRAHAPGCGAANPDDGYPYADGKIGLWGMDVGTTALKSPSTYYDFMSYCGPDWISDYSYEGILDYRQANAQWATPSAGPEASLLVWGRVVGNRIVLEPAFRVATQPWLPAVAGEYVLEGTAADGSVLFSLAFQPTPVPDGTPGEGHFAYAVPLGGFDETRLTGIQVRGGGRSPVRVESRTGPLPVAPEEGALAVEAAGASGAVVRWDAGVYPMALVRDPATGQILSFARGGRTELAVPAGEVEITLSDGVRSSPPVRRAVR